MVDANDVDVYRTGGATSYSGLILCTLPSLFRGQNLQYLVLSRCKLDSNLLATDGVWHVFRMAPSDDERLGPVSIHVF